MINVTRIEKPIELTEELQADLTDKFKATGESVWSKDFLKTALLKMTHFKCAYSECLLQEEGKYMEVEHFLPKERYKDLVLEWDNLLPANKKCNTTKGDLDVFAEPIINPCVHTPKKHLILKNYRFYHKTELGRRTIAATALNDREHFVKKRFEIGDKIQHDLVELREWFEQYFAGVDNSAIRLRNKITSFKAVLNESKPEFEYSATVATVLLHDDNYLRVREILLARWKWDEELRTLDERIAQVAFDII